MASISNKNGAKAVQVITHTGERKTINLGRASESATATCAKWAQTISDALKHGEPVDTRAIKWLSGLSDKVHARIARAGLAEPRQSTTPAAVAKLAATTQAYIDCRTDIEESSRENLRKARRNLVAFFGDDQDMAAITPAQADDFKRWLLAKYERTTVCQRIKRTKTMFKDAARRHLIGSNPFTDVVAGSDSNSDNDAFVDRETITKVMAATADNSWKLVIALSRFGGLRIPSELLKLRWVDVLWDQRRIVIHAKKTEKIDGKAVRIIPLFNELEPLLRQQFEDAEEGAEYVLPDRLRLHSNLGTTFQRFIKRAGVKPWPRQFHNLRASRETELLDLVGPKATYDWIGNDERTARKHYLRTTDEHFARVLGPAPAGFAAQIAAVRDGNGSQVFATPLPTIEISPELPWDAMACDLMRTSSALIDGPRGT